LLATAASPFTTTALLHARSATKDFFATGSEHSLQRFDAVIGGFEEEILDHRFSALELIDQHLRVRPARHFAAHFGHDAVTARAMQDDEHAPLARLHEVRGLRDLIGCYPWSPSARTPGTSFPFCHSFGRLPERRSKEYTV
jgi:hypothetical protein